MCLWDICRGPAPAEQNRSMHEKQQAGVQHAESGTDKLLPGGAGKVGKEGGRTEGTVRMWLMWMPEIADTSCAVGSWPPADTRTWRRGAANSKATTATCVACSLCQTLAVVRS